ncbi:MAG: histidinol-phosphate transaminase [Gemmatimonadales bacterium]
MTVSRRAFVRGLGGGALLVPFAAGRGLEARMGPEPVAGRRSRAGDLLRLDSNENPNGPSPQALEAIRDTLDEACRYPGDLERRLEERLAAHHRVGADQIVLGCGSTELLRVAVDAFASRGRWVVTAAPSFETPATYAAARGIPVVAVPVATDLGLDLDAMVGRSIGAGLVYLCNPNNPTGTVHSKSDVESFVDRVLAKAPAAQILIDEAYFEYVDRPGHDSMIPRALDDPRVFVLRTFSKVHGMAGLRVGYGIGRPETIGALAKYRLRLGVNVLGAAAALAAVGDERRVGAERAKNREAREYTAAFFERAGLSCASSATNFLMVDIGRPIETFRAACASAGVAVGRPFPPLTTHARISIGTLAEMRHATGVFGRILGV